MSSDTTLSPFEPGAPALLARSRWAIWLSPAVRACFCSLLGHAACLMALAMTFAAANRGSSPGLSLLAEASDSAACEDLAEFELPSAATEPAAAASLSAEMLFTPSDVAAPLAAFGELSQQGGFADDLPDDLLKSLPGELATGGEPTGRPLKKSANFYGIEADGNDFVFIVDMSGSMSGARFRRARAEVRRSIEALTPSQRFYVIFFNDAAWPMPAEDLLEASEENLNDTRRWLKQAHCVGGTNPLPAVLRALELGPDAIFLLSDGRFDAGAAVQIEQAETSPVIPVHTISFASREGEPMLRAIAEATGGTYRFVR